VASFTERVSVLIDVTGDKASSSLSSIKGAVADAEGGFGKLKAGAGAAFDSIGVLGPAAIAAAAGAAAKYVVDMVNGFEDLALKANDFASATGLAVDDASRWMEVAGDVGVNVGTLEGAINKMNLAAGKGDLAKLGIEGQTTSDQLLNALTHLQGIPDASTRATEGVKIFGKSWTQLAPLVESSKDLRQALKDVSEGQVIDQAEVEKAKRYRDAVDNLSDAWANFTLKVGEAAVGPITDTLELVGELADQIGSLGGKAGGGVDWGEVFGLSKLGDVTGGLKQAGDSSLSLVDNMKGIGKATFGLIPGLGGWADSTFSVTSAQDDAAQATEDATAAAKAQADQAKATQDAIELLTNAVLASFNSQLAYEDAQGKTTKAIGEYVAAAVEAGNAAGESKDLNDKYKGSMNDAEQAALGQAAAAAKLAEDTAKAKGETITAAEKNAAMRESLLGIVQMLGPNDPLRAALMGYITQLGQIPADKNTEITADTSQAEKAISNLMGSIRSFVLPHNTVLGATTQAAGYAAPAGVGVSATAASSSSVPGVSSSTSVAGGVRAGQVVNVTYNAPPGVNPTDVVRAIDRWTATRGTPAMTGATGL
jgi:hypothetical protein